MSLKKYIALYGTLLVGLLVFFVNVQPFTTTKPSQNHNNVTTPELSLHEKLLKEVSFMPLAVLEADFQKAIYDSQFPAEDCKKVKKLHCLVLRRYGFTAQMYNIRVCLSMAMQMNAVAILDDRDWTYCPNGWTKFFKPFGKCGVEHLDGGPPFEDYVGQGVILNITQELYDQLDRYLINPRLWVAGQFAKYIFRMNDKYRTLIDQEKRNQGWTRPVVGLHVRRGDKVGTESSFHDTWEYVTRVEMFFMLHFPYIKPSAKRVFLATDEMKVFADIQASGYKVLHTNNITAGMTDDECPRAVKIISDLAMLSESDFIVGTTSSKVTRTAMELHNTISSNGALNHVGVLSNDDMYPELDWHLGGNQEPFISGYLDKFELSKKADEGKKFTDKMRCIMPGKK